MELTGVDWRAIIEPDVPILESVVRGTILYFFVFTLMRGTLRRTAGELSMIDFILASPAMAERYLPRSYRIPQGSSETLGSDHNPVIAKFKTNQVGGRQQAEKRKD